MKSVFAKAQQQYLEALDSVSLSELAGNPQLKLELNV
jgi:hypothetical protein